MNLDLIAFNCRYTHSCLALFYVRNELARHLPGVRLRLRQFTINDPYFETLLHIADSGAAALLFSVYIWNAEYLKRLLTDLHHLLPATPLVLGGPQAEALRRTLSFRPTVVHHEIEGVEPGFYQDLAAGVLAADYQGGPVADFSTPYKQEDFASQLKNRYIYYETSRGCPFFCAYCLSSLSRGVVYKDLAKVKEELAAIFRERPTMLRFVDRTFNAEPRRTLAIWRFLKEEAPRPCTFHFEMAPDLFTDEMLDFLAGIEAGLFQFEIGLQDTNPATLRAIHRQMDVPRALTTIRRLRQLGNIRLHLDLILGLPEQDEASFAQSLRDALAVGPHYLQMGLLKVLPDTAIARQAADYGILACQGPPYQVLASRWLDHATLARLYWLGECLEAFYNRGHFQSFFAYAIRHEADMFSFFEGLADRCRERDFFGLAKTHGLMNDILARLVAERGEIGLATELLIFDWLGHGHRHLPAVFGDQEDLSAQRDYLWQAAPLVLPGLYGAKERNHFFKRGVFCRFSAALLAEVGLRAENGRPGYVAFLADGGQGAARPLLLPLSDEAAAWEVVA